MGRVARRAHGVAVLALGLLLAVPAGLAADLAAEGVRLGPPTAAGEFGEPRVFETSFVAPDAPLRVELLSTLPGEERRSVSEAALERTGPDGWRAVVHEAGHVLPNTTYEYRFRVVTEDGDVLGPVATHTVDDTRIAWQQLAGDGVTVWWERGDRAFAERALGVAEQAVVSARDLLGVDDVPGVDFFIYSDARAFRQALGPGTRENVGGEAHPAIHTLFGLIEPGQERSGWVEEVIVHELTHLVFDAAVSNPYGYPPRWLNEGLAVYLSKGLTEGDRAQVAAAARSGSLIPLEGLGGQFPTRAGGFSLAYAESVSAVDHFVETFGEETLVRLITSFADGRSLDEAFRVATGQGFRAFEDAWMAALGAERPEPYGPRPAQPGPLPAAWASPPAALLP